MNSLFALFDSIIPVSDDLKSRFSEILRVECFPKKRLLLKEGQVCNHVYFIEKGFIRSFYLKNTKEITSWFMKENDVIIAVNSFYKRYPSYEFIQTLEESTLYYVSYDELESLYKDFMEFNVIGRILTEKYYALSEERLYSMRKQTADARFRFLLKNHPEIIQRASLGYIASYLGISLETLSRIRRQR